MRWVQPIMQKACGCLLQSLRSGNSARLAWLAEMLLELKLTVNDAHSGSAHSDGEQFLVQQIPADAQTANDGPIPIVHQVHDRQVHVCKCRWLRCSLRLCW